MYSARFDKQDEKNQLLNESGLYIKLNVIHILTEIVIKNTDIKPPLEHQIQQHEMKDSGWTFDKINSMTTFFFQKNF